MSTPDDLPWPELGNVSRGATRGNQGQKGVLGQPDRDGRCVLQLRVQPGVLAVKLNRQASEWYRTLDNEVNRALKMTKTYWRKARRRQDYDARADQDHMELHEWLQQLKDKTMSHLELLMQKGDIQGPPYLMPDDIELSFLRKFIERQATGIPHNPRLRNAVGPDGTYIPREHSMEAFSPEGTSQDFLDHRQTTVEDALQRATSPSFRSAGGLAAEAISSKQALVAARASLARAQKETEDSFMRYTSCLDVERQARQAVLSAEKRRDDIMAVLLSQSQQLNLLPDARSRKSSISGDDRRSPPRYPIEEPRNPVDPFMNTRVDKPMEWPSDTQSLYNSEPVPHLDDSMRGRKRQWEHEPQLHNNGYPCDVHVAPAYDTYRTDRQYDSQDIPGLPPRKRIHHAMIPGFDVINGAPLQSQNMSLQS